MPEKNEVYRAAQESYYARTAETYDASHLKEGDEHSLALAYTVALMRLHGVRTVLDVGSGTGRAIEVLLKAGFEVKGLEPVQSLIDLGTKKGIPEGIIMQGYGEKIPYGAESFDAVCEFGVLHHIKRPNVVVKEMLRVARKGIFLSDTNRFGRAGLLARLIKLTAWKTGLWPALYLLWTRGKGCDISDCDGIAYSYSVYDSFDMIDRWADRTIVVPTKIEGERRHMWIHPLLTSSHALLCGLK